MDLKAPVPVFQWLRLLGLLQKRLRPSCTHLSFSVVWRPAFSCWLWLQLLQHELEGGKCESGKNQNPAQTGGINRNMPLSMLHLCAVTCNLAPPMRRSLMLQRSALQPLFVSLWSIFFSSPPPPPPPAISSFLCCLSLPGTDWQQLVPFHSRLLPYSN